MNNDCTAKTEVPTSTNVVTLIDEEESNDGNNTTAKEEPVESVKNEEEDQLSEEIEKVYLDIVDDVCFGLIIQVHRAAKLGYLFYADTDPSLDKQLEICDENDIFGLSSNSNLTTSAYSSSSSLNISSSSRNNIKYECVCPNCERNLAATRFAPHLEKCMGLGRNSSRIANRKIASFNDVDIDQLLDHDEALQQALAQSASASNIHELDNVSSSNNASNSGLKPPSAKKKRLNNSASMHNLNHQNATTNNSNTRYNFY